MTCSVTYPFAGDVHRAGQIVKVKLYVESFPRLLQMW